MRGKNASVLDRLAQERLAESLRLLKTARNGSGAEGAQAIVGVADGSLGAVLAGQLDDEGAALDGVDEDVARGEVGVRGPGADKADVAAALEVVVLGVDVEVGGLADTSAGGVCGDGSAVEDAEAGAVVRLVDVVVDDVLVVVDGLGGVLELCDIVRFADITLDI